jgi:hypothetical protein
VECGVQYWTSNAVREVPVAKPVASNSTDAQCQIPVAMDDNHLESIEPPPTIGPLTGGRELIAKGQEGRRREGLW